MFRCRTAEFTRVSKIESKNRDKLRKLRTNQSIGKIAKSMEYRMNEQLQNLINFGFLNWKDSRNLLIFQIARSWKFINLRFGKLQKFTVWKIPKIFQIVKFLLLTYS